MGRITGSVTDGGVSLNFVFLNSMDEYWESRLNDLKERFPEHTFISRFDHNNPRDLIQEAEALITGRLSEEELSKASRLKVLFVPWTGVNSLPLKELKSRSVTVSNNHGNAAIVAERAVTLALAVTGRVVFLHKEMERGIWPGRTDDRDTSWFSMQGKTCALLGTGEIGVKIAEMLKAFRCRVVAFRRHRSKGKPECIDVLVQSINEAIEVADVVFIALPLTKETRGLLSAALLSSMKGKFLINISRGEIVDEKGLYEALKNGVLAGAAIDTWYNYPSRERPATLPSVFPIHSLPNVVLSPHVASWTEEGVQLMIDETVKSIVSYIVRGTPEHIIDLDLAY